MHMRIDQARQYQLAGRIQLPHGVAADTAFHRRNHTVLHSDIKISFPCRRIIDHIPVFDQ